MQVSVMLQSIIAVERYVPGHPGIDGKFNHISEWFDGTAISK